MRVQISQGLAILLLVAATLPVWSQATGSASPGTGGTQPKDSGAAPAATGAIESIESEDRMVTPAPVSIEGYPLSLGAESERANYLRGGLTFSSTYDDNVLANTGRTTPDVSYSIWPWISLNQSRPRLKWSFSYSPGFTFYQKNTNLNEADHAFETKLEYRLSPNVTLHLRDAFSKSSNFFNQFEQNPGGGTSSVGLQGQNNSVIPPLAERISNAGDVQLTYQFSQYGMVGMTGSFSQLRYPNRTQAGGLLDADVKAGGLFYTHRVSRRNYIGATYRYQDLLASPSAAETQTHSLVLFYTIYFRPTVSLSVFGGPEYSEYAGSTCQSAARRVTGCRRQSWMARKIYQFCCQRLAQSRRRWRVGERSSCRRCSRLIPPAIYQDSECRARCRVRDESSLGSHH